MVAQPSLASAASSTSTSSTPAAASLDPFASYAWLAPFPDTDALRRALDEEDDRVFETYFLQCESDSEFRAGLRAMNQGEAHWRVKRRQRASIRPELGAATIPMPRTRRMRRCNHTAAQLIKDEADAAVPVAAHRPLPKSLQRRARRAASLSPSEPTSVRLRHGADRLRSQILDELRTSLLEKRIFRPVDWRSTTRDDIGCETPPFEDWAEEEEEEQRRAERMRQERIELDAITAAQLAAAQAAQAPFCVPTGPLQRPKHLWSTPRHGLRYGGYEQWLLDERAAQKAEDAWIRAQEEEDHMVAMLGVKQKQRLAAAKGCKTRKEQKMRVELKRIEIKEARSKPNSPCPTLKLSTPIPSIAPAAVSGNARARRAAARQAAAPRSRSQFVSPAIVGAAVLALRTTRAQRARTTPKQHVTITQICTQLREAVASPIVTAKLLSKSFHPSRVATSKPYTLPYTNDNWRARRMMSGYEHRFAHFNRCPNSLQPALDLPVFQEAFYALFRGVIEASLNSVQHGTRITALKLASIPEWAGKWMKGGYGCGSFERRFFLALLRRIHCGSNQPGVAPAQLSLRFAPVRGCRYSGGRDSRITFDSNGDNGSNTHDARACRLECQLGLPDYPWSSGVERALECYSPANLKAMHQRLRHNAACAQLITVAPLIHPASLSFSPSKLSSPDPKRMMAPLVTRSVMVCAAFDAQSRTTSRVDRDFVNSASILPCVEVEYEFAPTSEPLSVAAVQRAVKRADALEPTSRLGISRARRAASRCSTLSRAMCRHSVKFGAATGAERRSAALWQKCEDALRLESGGCHVLARDAREDLERPPEERTERGGRGRFRSSR